MEDFVGMHKDTRQNFGTIARVYADRAVRQPGCEMRRHHSHEYFELFYLEQGVCRFLIDDRLYDLREGDFALIPPRVFHHSQYAQGVCRRVTVYFRREDVTAEALEWLPGGEAFLDRAQVFHVGQSYREPVAALVGRMVAESKTDDRHSGMLLYWQLQELLVLCRRCCDFSQEAPEAIPTGDHQVLLAARFIAENYMRTLTAADIAAAAGFSPNYLSRRFRQVTGVSIHEYLVFTRLHHAAEQLVSTGDTITQIALRCGFSGSNYFKDAFKKKYGVTPREYRNEQ